MDSGTATIREVTKRSNMKNLQQTGKTYLQGSQLLPRVIWRQNLSLARSAGNAEINLEQK